MVDPDGPLGGCGARGCMEAIAGARGLGDRWAPLTGREAGAAEVTAAVQAGDEVARRLWDEVIDGLARAVAPVLAGAGTELLVLGGGMSGAGPLLIGPLADRLGRLLPGRSVRVRTTVLGDRAAALGAAALGAGLPGAPGSPGRGS